MEWRFASSRKSRVRWLRALRLAALLALGTASGALPARAQDPVAAELPAYEPADPAAAIVTAETLLATDRFWPRRGGLVRAWTPPGREASLPIGTTGVLIRVEPAGTVRIDFGRDGRFAVPVEATDVVERANRVRRGELEKTAPNLVLTLGPRLVDLDAPELGYLTFTEVNEAAGYLAVSVDPSAEEFPALAKALAPLQHRNGVLTVLFPEGFGADLALRDRLREFGWPAPFLPDHLAEPYAKTLLPDDLSAPAALLMTRDGRLLEATTLGEDSADRLAAAIERHFPEPSAVAGSDGEASASPGAGAAPEDSAPE